MQTLEEQNNQKKPKHITPKNRKDEIDILSKATGISIEDLSEINKSKVSSYLIIVNDDTFARRKNFQAVADELNAVLRKNKEAEPGKEYFSVIADSVQLSDTESKHKGVEMLVLRIPDKDASDQSVKNATNGQVGFAFLEKGSFLAVSKGYHGLFFILQKPEVVLKFHEIFERKGLLKDAQEVTTKSNGGKSERYPTMKEFDYLVGIKSDIEDSPSKNIAEPRPASLTDKLVDIFYPPYQDKKLNKEMKEVIEKSTFKTSFPITPNLSQNLGRDVLDNLVNIINHAVGRKVARVGLQESKDEKIPELGNVINNAMGREAARVELQESKDEKIPEFGVAVFIDSATYSPENAAKSKRAEERAIKKPIPDNYGVANGNVLKSFSDNVKEYNIVTGDPADAITTALPYMDHTKDIVLALIKNREQVKTALDFAIYSSKNLPPQSKSIENIREEKLRTFDDTVMKPLLKRTEARSLIDRAKGGDGTGRVPGK